MSLDFGKLNFSISFNPTSAFPIDARSYFESYADAVKAAAGAKPAGSAESVYYYGQTLVVVEANKASFYIIQPNNTLSAVTGAESIPVNPKLFEVDSQGNLSLKGFESAVIGNIFSMKVFFSKLLASIGTISIICIRILQLLFEFISTNEGKID